MEIISSVNNEKVKRAQSLNEKKFRRYYGAFLVEGDKLVREALGSGLEVTKLYVEQGQESKYQDIMGQGPEVYVLSRPAFEKIAYTSSPQGIIAEVKMRESGAPDLSQPFLVLDTIQDPGNMGTIIRTAAAVGFKDIILLDSADPFSPKVVRASSGGIFYTNVFQLSIEELLQIVQARKLELYVADMHGQNVFELEPPKHAFGLVVGSEGQGVRKELKEACQKVLSLPMKPEMESLNAGVSASVIMYVLGKDHI